MKTYKTHGNATVNIVKSKRTLNQTWKSLKSMRKHNSTLETHCKIMKQINKQDKTYRNTLENHDEHETTSKKHRKT